MSKEVRLQKFIADCGITSRRKAEVLIAGGRVEVNGMTLRELGSKINPEVDVVTVDGKIADFNSVQQIYAVINKPRGYMTTASDPEGRKTVMDLCREVSERIYPVGRLDYLSEGLLILTNDGELANMIMHPRYNITKVYEVKVFGVVNEKILKRLRAGAMLEDGFVKPQSVRVIKELHAKTWLEFRLGEGKNREIRKICETHGLTVDKLKRVAIGNLTVDGIAPGSIRYTSKSEILRLVGLQKDGTTIEGFECTYMSAKRSVNLKKSKHRGEKTLANDSNYEKFRKGTYFQAIKDIKSNKIAALEKERDDAFAVKEEAHQARKTKKKIREFKKRKSAENGVHASFA